MKPNQSSRMDCVVKGCGRHPKDGWAILRISPKGKGQPFRGMCSEHYSEWVETPLVEGRR